MKSILLCLLIFIQLLIQRAADLRACSAFYYKTDEKGYFAYSFDWDNPKGALFLNARSLQKTALPLLIVDPPSTARLATWTSLYGSLTFSFVGPEVPMSGMNERGLAMSLLWLDESKYDETPKKPVINESQFIQYILDTSSNVFEALENAEKVQILKAFAPVHYMICDSKECAVLEMINGRPHVFQKSGLPYSALENTPYHDQTFNSKEPSRMSIASTLSKEFLTEGDPWTYGFYGLSILRQDDFSKWNIVYELSDKPSLQFRFADERDLRKTIKIELYRQNFSNTGRLRALDFNEFQPKLEIIPVQRRARSFIKRVALASEILDENTVEAFVRFLFRDN